MARHYGWGLYLRMVWRTFFHPRDSFGRWSRRRAFVMPVLIPFFALIQAVHWLGFLLDNVFFRGYRRIEVKEPIFIVGIPRSGTTRLHRLLMRDDRFITFANWEVWLAPSITERKVLGAFGRVDRLLGGLGKRLLLRIDARVFEDFNRIHKTGLFEAEEDFALCMPLFASILLLVIFPFPDLLMSHARFDTDVPEKERRHILRHYRRCLQRHLYVHGPGKRILSKNPTFSTMIESLRETFPDAHVACCVRRPDEAAVSLMSLLSFVWQAFNNVDRTEELRGITLDVVSAYYRHPMERLAHWPEDRAQFVRYDDLARNPGETVRAIYGRFQLDVPPALGAHLAELDERAGSYRSPHQYRPEDYGLTPQQIYHDYQDVYGRFTFAAPLGEAREANT